MCGIVGILGFKKETQKYRIIALKMAKRIRHRGPDWSGIFADDKAVLAHERLAIVDVQSGAQPLYDKKNGNVLAVNGEIYNHLDLRNLLDEEHEWQTSSDCEILLYLYDELGPEFVHHLNGIFAFILYCPKAETFFIARDHIGINPLYMGWDESGCLYVASELKSLVDYCKKIEEFPPGHYYLGKEEKIVRYYSPKWSTVGQVPQIPLDLNKLRQSLEAAIKRQLMCDVPFGLLISGGLDSSIIAAIAAKYSKKRIESNDHLTA